MPEITYSIANAPNNKPNTLWITLNKDKLIISTSLEDNHIQTPARITESITGKKLITLLISSGSDFSAISMVIVIAPGPACLLYTSPSPRDAHESRMPSSA